MKSSPRFIVTKCEGKVVNSTGEILPHMHSMHHAAKETIATDEPTHSIEIRLNSWCPLAADFVKHSDLYPLFNLYENQQTLEKIEENLDKMISEQPSTSGGRYSEPVKHLISVRNILKKNRPIQSTNCSVESLTVVSVLHSLTFQIIRHLIISDLII